MVIVVDVEASARAQPNPDSEALEQCVGALERAAASVRTETATIRARSAASCPGAPSQGVPAKERVLIQALENAIRNRLTGVTQRGGPGCGQLEFAFDGMIVRVRGTAPNRLALEGAAAELRQFLPDLTIDLKDVDSLGCRRRVSGTGLALMLDDGGEPKWLTFDQAKSLGKVFPSTGDCAEVGPTIGSSLPTGLSNRRFWVWSIERNEPVYCFEASGSWSIRDWQLHDGRGAAVLPAR